jgi:hypothetical protein
MGPRCRTAEAQIPTTNSRKCLGLTLSDHHGSATCRFSFDGNPGKDGLEEVILQEKKGLAAATASALEFRDRKLKASRQKLIVK